MSDTMIDHYDGLTGKLVLSMPREAAEDCSAPGQAADESVAYWLRHGVIWHTDETELRQICKETGAWEDWKTADLDIIQSRVLWMAACDWRESEKDREDYADAMESHQSDHDFEPAEEDEHYCAICGGSQVGHN